MKPISFVAYGDLGLHTSRPITELARGLHERGLLEQLYCRGVEECVLPSNLVTAPIPFGRMLPRAMTGINRFVTENFDKRYYSEQLFDFFAARAAADHTIQLHHTPGYLRTLRAGNRSGDRTVVKATTEYARPHGKRVAKAYRDFGIDPPEAVTSNRRFDLRQKTLEECDRILAISSFVEESLVRSGFPPEKVAVTPLGVTPDEYPTSKWDQSGPFTVLYVGSVTIAKGVPYLIEAWRRNGWGDDEDAKLLLCGHVSQDVREMLDSAEFKNIETPGFVDPGEYYHRASVFVFPSVSDGFGKAPLEAMAAGVPAIATETTGMPDIIEPGREGYIVPSREVGPLADRLQYLRDHPTERRQMAENALERAEEQTWDRHVENVVNALEV
ncbi:glycosyltransferase family 4 protein [Haloarcula onubensis]|uniref:Glycosyltransferase family 4 protein n=1 Tax=Haloarcula onubensis TaxID=2950539 RepID=A0ABU2FNE9_9EURY|nr:glycosyltransferase family 4 protein [Halomicroarcula sp. S3CR25-11]MDS0282279.1 glycosyltransferase family 4 protein [Halomicroarcula sp. S3CR25-11]